ncbi:helix-turn-helix domain-containing protein [Kitasatospora sp. NBC_01266]|uniref:helix-turn-helix domain-containing protein n=1 Tax=Kitasatospora sp. NBC_01266 TaxID=2903572 RepID=UPI002E3480F2|nr:helix-turn-helix domain-containing protein [Kitasatospora sp. NBC_01266]
MLSVPTGTVSWWKHEDLAKRGQLPGRKRSTCPICYDDQLNKPAYSYLLGLYLGDGHIIQPKQHRAPNLAVTCDNSWPGVMDEVEQAMRDVLPNSTPCRVRRKGCKDVKVYSMHLPCLFPQHGPGKKHDRPIVLAPWQQDIVAAHPWHLLRGLIHSDGCRIVNWATRTVNGVVRRHEYPRYFFTNKSTDIIGIFTDTLDTVGVQWKAAHRTNGAVNISIARRASVALMDQHIGPKY